MNAKVELLAAENQTFIQRGKKNILSTTKPSYRNGEESVIASGIAGHDGRVAVRTRLIRSDDLTLERILQVYQLGLVEF
jgi:hypothetical protein